MSLCSALVSSFRRDIIDIYHHGVEAIKPRNLIRQALNIENNTLMINCLENTYEKDLSNINLNESNVHILGIGKTAISMTRELCELVQSSSNPRSFKKGFIIAPINLRAQFLNDASLQKLFNTLDITCRFGAEDNLPDEMSLAATKEMLSFVDETNKEDRSSNRKPVYMVLIGGGGSACLTYPKHISLKEKLGMIRFLQQRGANIIELNSVRSFFSHVKGGQLAEYILDQNKDASILSLILSDVIGSPIEFIASGPTFIPESRWLKSKNWFETLIKYHYEEIDAVLRKCNVDNKTDIRLEKVNRRMQVINKIIGDNSIAIKAAKERAESLGYKVELLSNIIEGYTEDVVDKIRSLARNIELKEIPKVLILAGGEATVRKADDEKWGKGGRVQEMALDYLLATGRADMNLGQGVIDMFLAGTTDGQDGPTDVSACLASSIIWSELDSASSSDLKAMAIASKLSHDSYNFWKNNKDDWVLRTGPTETNVMDIYMMTINKIEARPD